MDNEFNFPRIIKLLEDLDIEVHFTKPNSHTGNSDIEVFHRTLAEKIRAILNGKMNPSIHEIRVAVHKANLFYNTSIHSTTRQKPYDIQKGNIDKNNLYDLMIRNKEKIIDKLNINREEYTENRSEGFVKNSRTDRNKIAPRYKYNKLNDQHTKNIQRERKSKQINQDNLIKASQMNRKTQRRVLV